MNIIETLVGGIVAIIQAVVDGIVAVINAVVGPIFTLQQTKTKIF